MTRLILLPGMDGTGDLFKPFLDVLPREIPTEVAQYPLNRSCSYSELLSQIETSISESEPVVLLAESFSTPLAIQYAAKNPANLKGIVICAGFASNPALGWQRWLVRLAAPVLFRYPISESATRQFLLGSKASKSLVVAVRAAIRKVDPYTLASRLDLVLECDVRTDLKRVRVPMLYLQGLQDRLVGNWNLEDMRRIKPGLQVASVDGPHLLLQAEPLWAAEVVSEFVKTLPFEEKLV